MVRAKAAINSSTSRTARRKRLRQLHHSGVVQPPVCFAPVHHPPPMSLRSPRDASVLQTRSERALCSIYRAHATERDNEFHVGSQPVLSAIASENGRA